MAKSHVSMKGRGREAFLPEPEPEIAVAPKPAASVSIVLSADQGESVQYPIAQLWLDDQPRQIVPDSVLASLIVNGQAHPPQLLDELKGVVAGGHSYYSGVLDALRALARTIESDGVLEPLLVIRLQDEVGERYILRDGHRRSLASLIAGRETVPVRVIDEASALQSAARQLVVNIQRADLTALEKGRWLYRLARLVEAQIRTEQGISDGQSVVDALVQGEDQVVIHVENGAVAGGDGRQGGGIEDGSGARTYFGPGSAPTIAAEKGAVDHTNDRRSGPPEARALAVAVRRRVLELTGLGQAHYYRLLYLNRLSTEAQEAGLGLSEGQLRPVTSLAPLEQVEIVRFIAARKLTSKESETLVGVAKSGDRDAVKRVMQRLTREEVAPSRSAVSWEPLLHALPKDLWARCSSLRAELAALPEERRSVRLRTLEEQRRLALDFTREIDEILALYLRDAASRVDSE